MFKSIDLTVFPQEREEKLRAVKRYEYFETMFYRSNNWLHIQRVLWLTEAIIPLAQKYLNFDPEKARAYAIVHDDAEIVTGDIQSIVKLRMSKEEQIALEKKEEQAIEQLIEQYPKEFHGYSYRELLLNATKKDTIESHLVSYVDKLDGFCESLHEIYAGNIGFIRAIVFYARATALMSEKFPQLKELLADKTSPLTYLADQVSPFDINYEMFKHLNKSHTEESLNKPCDFPFYNAWRKIILEKGGEEGKKYLLTQKEFLPS
jgi:5'-deoxynucleotidase YfbR-like HD superfamily hydrolase